MICMLYAYNKLHISHGNVMYSQVEPPVETACLLHHKSLLLSLFSYFSKLLQEKKNDELSARLKIAKSPLIQWYPIKPS